MISRKENFQKEHMQNYDADMMSRQKKKIKKEQMQTMMLI